MWLCLNVKHEAELSFMGHEVTLPISGMADGCIGAALVFDTKENAVEYAAGNSADIIQVEYKENTK